MRDARWKLEASKKILLNSSCCCLSVLLLTAVCYLFFCFFVDVFFGYGVHTLPKNLEVSIENAAAGRTFAELTSLPQWSTYEVNVKRFVVLK